MTGSITEAYETWLREQIPVVEADLEHKHEVMARDEFAFFRATYYLWLVRVGERAPDVLKGVSVPIVGDLHAENFGTWRDGSEDLRWGVNDLDELARGSWLLDPLRLAVSAALSPHITLKTKQIAALVLEAYANASPAPSPKVSDHPHLAAVVPEFKDADAYFTKLSTGELAHDLPPTVLRTAASTVPGTWSPTWRARTAGAGSLGHRRAVGLGATSAGPEAREAKQLDPGSAAWARTRDDRLPVPAPDLYAQVVRALDAAPASVRTEGWQVRALAPDEVRIELGHLNSGDERLVLRSMAAAVVPVHSVDPGGFARAQAEAKAFDADLFAGYVKTMKQTFEQDFGNCP